MSKRDVIFIMLLFYLIFIMVLSLFAPKRKRKSSSKGGGGSKALETVILIGGLGALGIVGYYVMRGGKGFEEAQDTAGQAAKDLVDILRSGAEAVGNTSCHVQNGFSILTGGLLGKGPECRGWKTGSSSTPTGGGGGSSSSKKSEPSSLFDPLKRYYEYAQPRIEDKLKRDDERAAATRNAIGESIGNGFCWFRKTVFKDVECTDLNKRDLYVLTSLLEGGSPKPIPKITNQTYNTLINIGAYPYWWD
jgi:hypothetical protein